MNFLLPLPTREKDNIRTIDFCYRERERKEFKVKREKVFIMANVKQKKCRCPVYVSLIFTDKKNDNLK